MREIPLKMLVINYRWEPPTWEDKLEHYLRIIPRESAIMNLMRLVKLELMLWFLLRKPTRYQILMQPDGKWCWRFDWRLDSISSSRSFLLGDFGRLRLRKESWILIMGFHCCCWNFQWLQVISIMIVIIR